ncbi:MAG TPA: hypothetical protein VNK41_06450 [Vicinamibacterales bacterium]|nr:hypothetical protein [Vicinamibacterales bacterium]
MKHVDTAHPHDEQLILRYFESTRDDALELHLLRCTPCAAHANRLAALLDADHDRTLRAADASFNAARLAEQRAAILARIARPGGAEVVRFPRRNSRVPAAARVVRTRWAAAAILVFSVALGSGTWFHGSRSSGTDSEAFTATTRRASLAAIHEGEDAMLLEIDYALARPRTVELRALEALTPRADESVDF